MTGPEFGLWRELVTFESADEAVAVIDDLRAAVEDLPDGGGRRRGQRPLLRVPRRRLPGYDDATFSYTYAEGLGGVVYQFVRVGHAVLATAQYGEWSPETPQISAPRSSTAQNTQLTPLMCEYTDEGC